MQSIVKPVVRVKRSHLRNGLLTTYFIIQDDKPKSYSNRRMMKKTNIYHRANRPESVSTSSCDKKPL